MTEGIGKALASAIKDPSATGAERRGRHIFRNQHRRDIFSLLTMKPCASILRIASELGLSGNTVRWHLGALNEAGYLIRHSVGGQAVFFPEGLVDRNSVVIFHSVNHPRQGAAYKVVLLNPGLSQLDIASMTGESRQTVARTLKNLEERGLLTTVLDGARSRYYPTKLLPDGAEAFYKQSKEFSEYILKRLEHEGGKSPTIIKKTLDRMLVEIGYASDRFTLEIGINPFMTCNIC